MSNTQEHVPGGAIMLPTSTEHLDIGADGLLQPGESLRNGIWPRSLALWMAAFYVALFIIRPWEQLFPWMVTIHFERVYALCMIAVVMLTRGIRCRPDRQSLAVLMFLACLGVSGLCAWNPDLSTNLLYRYLTLVVFFVILVSVIKSPYELIFMVSSYVVVMAVYLAKAQWEFFVHGQHRYDQGVTRMVGIESTYGGPNSLAMSIVVSLPMLLFLWNVRDQFCCTWPPVWRRWFGRGLAVYLGLALSSIALTNSRSGMVSLILFVGLVAMRGTSWSRKVSYALAALVLLGCGWMIMPEDSRNRFRTIWDPSAGPANAAVSADGRQEGFRAGMTAFRRFPLTGVGIGNFTEYRQRLIDGIPLQAHNLPGQLLGETGLVGAAGFLLLIGAMLRNCRRTKRLAQCRRQRGTLCSHDPRLDVLWQFAGVARVALLLLLFEGIFAHNVYRFNWLWLAAFAALAVEFAGGLREVQEDV